MIKVPTNRPATHPGEILREDFLVPMGLTQKELADAILVPFQRVNEIVSGKRGLTPSTALRLAKYFGNSPGFWLNLQMRVDLQTAENKEKADLKKVRRRRPIAA
ncbi:MAG: HigA family addiction module antitoxin [Pyrinomonadaceae bacterium]